MEITVNQQTYSVSEICSLQQMLDTILLQPVKGIAIAVNQDIIAKSYWPTHSLKPGDNLTIIKATQGG
ncbi:MULTISPECIES: sulfur carrier protein ThiS [unclassified Mucilaginibacter]|uniref:sulfur carrier protein ThiS n=1 Tax=unclassified Mucilaginibacter TaxID=2617802 RepID=UPI002AC8ED67|nr:MULTISPECIES: sulfur carrier protein ThiS [unclassified Mucilaginibacter]MEB0261982.1 sulfur carrier protein ThiS [Mucilaginibacter sp. 10I4]MEB0277282.1 sulfur carrier protein ThiS [Mucilaginibacter sp. 10B2]MEB0300854.1 sulfur carrier protein ThiS [Mucilaginibacter sp. 5C4]WPX25408.1 sulfur carrier protein ThiS [Mucilaginibacter sp. 5C4]